MSDVQEPIEGNAEEEPTEAVFKAPGTELPQEEPEVAETEGELPAFMQPPPAPEAPQPPSPPVERRRPAPSLFWPLLLIGVGVLLLLSNLGYVPWSSWSALWRLWPVLLIALGVDVLFGRRTMTGALFSGLVAIILIGGAVALVLFGQNIPMVSELTRSAEWQVTEIAHPLDGVDRATVYVDWGSPPGTLGALKDSRNLIEGRIAHTGELIFDVDARGSRADIQIDQRSTGPSFGPLQSLSSEEVRWQVWLNPGVIWEIRLNSGSGRCDFDLSELGIDGLVLDSGSGAVDLALPADSSFEGRIDGGSGALTITVPKGVGVRVDLESGSGAFRPAERFELVSGERDDDGVWQTENWDRADVRIELRIDQGSGRVVIE